MVASLALTTLLALVTARLVGADVSPSEPSPGSVFNAGQTCPVTWLGDDSGSTILWKNMTIQLMTGDNINMVLLETVATGQDGTKDGTFKYTCPQVNPNSAIYFYQFTTANSPNKTWTSRFAIASSSGQTTPPSQSVQPGSNDAIPWGTGALVNSTDGGAALGASANATSTANGTTSTVAGASESVTSSLATASINGTSTASSAISTSTSATSVSKQASGALKADIRTWQAASTCVVGAIIMALFL